MNLYFTYHHKLKNRYELCCISVQNKHKVSKSHTFCGAKFYLIYSANDVIRWGLSDFFSVLFLFPQHLGRKHIFQCVHVKSILAKL